jgi:tetratricopeptide (TPR) repeat protein
MLPRLVIALAFAGLLSHSYSQTRPKRVTPLGPTQVQTFEKQSKTAILVGVGSYPEASGFSRLRYPAKDVAALGAELDHQGYTVRSIIDDQATRGIVRKALTDLAGQVNNDDGAFLFYFSGHGYEQEGTNYLAVYGSVSDDLKREGFSLDELLRLVSMVPARQKVLFIDACRNNPTIGRNSAAPRSFQQLARSEGVKVLYSTRAGGTSFEDDELQHGVYTYFLVRGFQGEAAGDDRLITFRDLADYITESLRDFGVKKGHVQVPFEASDSSGDFLLAKARATVPERLPGRDYLETAEANAKAGLEFAAQGKYREAVDSFTKAMGARAPVAEEFYYRGLAYGHLQEYQNAVEDFTKALELGGETATIYANRGFAYSELKELDAAIHDFSRAIELKPDYVAAYVSRGMAYTSALNFKPALQDLDKAIEMQSNLPAAWRARGRTLLLKGDYTPAIRDLSRAIELDPGAPTSYVERAKVYSLLNDPEKALSDLSQAVQRQPSYAPALSARAQIYIGQGQFQHAIEDYSKVLELQPAEASALSNRGYAYAALGQFALSIQDCNRAIQLDPGFAEAYNNRGFAFARQKDYRRALEDYNRAVDLKQDYAAAYTNRAAVRKILGDSAGARSDTEKAHALELKAGKIAL